MSIVSNAYGLECDSPVTDRQFRPVRGLRYGTIACLFWLMWSFIGLASAFDAYLVYHFLDAIPYVEKNPLCRFLIMLDPQQLSIFLPAKAFGTLTVLAILRLIFVRRREYSLPITSGVAVYQAGLVVYLVAA